MEKLESKSYYVLKTESNNTGTDIALVLFIVLYSLLGVIILFLLFICYREKKQLKVFNLFKLIRIIKIEKFHNQIHNINLLGILFEDSEAKITKEEVLSLKTKETLPILIHLMKQITSKPIAIIIRNLIHLHSKKD